MAWVNDSCSDDSFVRSSTLAMKQLLLILIECTTVPVESIARLGCSCFR